VLNFNDHIAASSGDCPELDCSFPRAGATLRRMVSLRGLGKPQYLFRPSQILRRLLQEISPRTQGDVRLPWGLRIALDHGDTVSEAIRHQGMYDLVTTEVLWRLTSRGECAVDIGANIGYVTGLLAVRTGPAGNVFAFEPHPKTHVVLLRNVTRWSAQTRCGRIATVQAALSSADGTAILNTQDGYDSNASHSHLSAAPDAAGIQVQTLRFDTQFAAQREFGVIKIDAEGHEPAIFAGMTEHLRSGRIRDIVYEENNGYPAASHKALENAGYTLFAFREQLSGPQMVPAASNPGVKRAYDTPPSYLATRDPERAKRLLSRKGWESLRGR
jgi:FkbM family methyltransferase